MYYSVLSYCYKTLLSHRNQEGGLVTMWYNVSGLIEKGVTLFFIQQIDLTSSAFEHKK